MTPYELLVTAQRAGCAFEIGEDALNVHGPFDTLPQDVQDAFERHAGDIAAIVQEHYDDHCRAYNAIDAATQLLQPTRTKRLA